MYYAIGSGMNPASKTNNLSNLVFYYRLCKSITLFREQKSILKKNISHSGETMPESTLALKASMLLLGLGCRAEQLKPEVENSIPDKIENSLLFTVSQTNLIFSRSVYYFLR